MTLLAQCDLKGVDADTKPVQYWYRYEDVQFASMCDEFGHSEGPGTMQLMCHEYRVLKETECGVWIDMFPKRFVKRHAKKHFACPTKEEALKSFKRRKEVQINILKTQLDRAYRALQLAEEVR
jgi:hypothetical protein